jgi:hypothetical protein
MVATTECYGAKHSQTVCDPAHLLVGVRTEKLIECAHLKQRRLGRDAALVAAADPGCWW